MKTFKDLEFEKWPQNVGYDASRAFMEFPNGYGISVITGKMAYSDEKHPYEAAVLYKGDLYCTIINTEGVIGHLDEEGVTEIMKKIQEL